MSDLLDLTDGFFGPIAGILLIIGAGGAFNEVLIASGIGDGIAHLLSALPVSPVILAWLIALLLHFAVGSATVAMISAAGIVLPMVTDDPSLSPEVMAIAVGAGAIGLTQVTDSLFWPVKEYLGMSAGRPCAPSPWPPAAPPSSASSALFFSTWSSDPVRGPGRASPGARDRSTDHHRHATARKESRHDRRPHPRSHQ